MVYLCNVMSWCIGTSFASTTWPWLQFILKRSDKVWKLGQCYWGSGCSQPIVARNAILARNSVRVLGRSIRGKARQLEKEVLQKAVSDYCTVILKKTKTKLKDLSAGDLGCFSDQLLTEEWADGDRGVRDSMCSWIFEGGVPCTFVPSPSLQSYRSPISS